MRLARQFLFTALFVVVAVSGVCAQRRADRLPPPRDPQFYEPRNRLEEIDGRIDSVLVKGSAWIGTASGSNGSARVEAIEVRNTKMSQRVSGVVITFADAAASGQAPE